MRSPITQEKLRSRLARTDQGEPEALVPA